MTSVCVFCAGLFTGVFLTILTLGLCASAKRADEALRGNFDHFDEEA